MNLQEALLNAVATYGVVAIFVSVFISSIGLPLPSSFLLIVAGSFVASGDLQFWPVVIAAVTAAILGDHAGYMIGWLGGPKIAAKISQRFNAVMLLKKAETASHKWGGASIFFSRWLITALGPPLNLTSGFTRYALLRFSLWDVAGELLWVVLYVQVGRLFSARVAEISDALGDFTYVLLGIVAVIIIGYQLFKTLRKPNGKAE